MKQLLFILSVALILFSCKKNELGPQCISCQEELIENTSLTDIIIINEGNYGWGNASISLYNKSTNQVNQNVFWNQNNSSLGDVAQSIYQHNNLGYIVVNNSGKIEVVNINDFSSVTTINGLNSPRYFLPVTNNKAYVTELFNNKISIINLNSNTITGSITANGWTEELLMVNDSVYVCDMDNNKILIINPQNDVVVGSVDVGENPNSLVIDKNNKIWIMCSGGFNSTNGQLIRFNPTNRIIEQTFVFTDLSDSPGKLKINALKDKLYYLNDGVYQFSISDNSLTSSPLISSNGNIYYGLGIDPANNDIYVADAIDYVQNGIIFRYNTSGNLIHQFNSGIIPGEFLFIK